MQRGSNRLNVHRDDEAKHEMQGRLRSSHRTRAEEWRDPEPSADDDPEVAEGPVPPPGTPTEREAADEELRYELARHLGIHPFPTNRDGLVLALQNSHAPDQLVDTARSLPDGDHAYQNVQEVMDVLGRKPKA